LSTQLHKHIDRMDELEESLKAEIDKMILAIDTKELMKDPHGVMLNLVEEIKGLLMDKYMADATKAGLDFVKVLERLEKKGDGLNVDPSKNPNKNRELVK